MYAWIIITPMSSPTPSSDPEEYRFSIATPTRSIPILERFLDDATAALFRVLLTGPWSLRLAQATYPAAVIREKNQTGHVPKK